MAKDSKQVSIKQIAKLAGCCPATVSNILNNARYSGKEIRSKVLSICRELNYAPNVSARNLRTGKTGTIGVMFYKISANIFKNSFYLELLHALQHRLMVLNYDLLLSEFQVQDEEAFILPRVLRQGKVDGLILLGGIPSKFTDLLKRKTKNLLMLDSYCLGIDSITSDGYEASYEIVRSLAEGGHKRFAYFAYSYEDSNTEMRISGYNSALKKFGVKGVVRNFDNFEDAGIGLKELMQSKNPPTAILAVNDNMAFFLISEAKRLGLSIPRDLSVFGFDGISITTSSSPSISTVLVDINEMGTLAADMIVERVNSENVSVRNIHLHSPIIFRESSSKLNK